MKNWTKYVALSYAVLWLFTDLFGVKPGWLDLPAIAAVKVLEVYTAWAVGAAAVLFMVDELRGSLYGLGARYVGLPLLEVPTFDSAPPEPEGMLHAVFIALDRLLGVFGLRDKDAMSEEDLTISARTALAILDAQRHGHEEPLWAVVLGPMLETWWCLPLISYRGHLQAALQTDYMRCRLAARRLEGL
jgi:hypothetical protein